MLEYVRTRHGDILKARIRDSGKLEEDVEQKLERALDEFANVFQASAGSEAAERSATCRT